MADIANEYLVKRGDGNFVTIASLFSGVRITKIDGFMRLGKPVNIYTSQWINSQTEDYKIANGNNQVIRENVDIDITFIVSDKYGAVNVRQQHDAFVAYMTNGALYIKSNYVDRTLRCVCLKEYQPTKVHLKRPTGSNYMTGTITLHALDSRAGEDDGYIDDPYGSSTTINTSNVFDTSFDEFQDELNQVFFNKSDVKVSVVGTTLMMTTTAPNVPAAQSISSTPDNARNANAIYDTQLGETQNLLNQRFGAKSELEINTNGTTLNITN